MGCARGSDVDVEIILVEWRPPNTTQTLQSLMGEWIDREFVQRASEFNCRIENLPLVRVITVSDADAAAALTSIGQVARGGMLEWYCKNIGLRRASGDLWLTINADDIFSHALFDFLARARYLRRDTFYLAQNLGMYFKGTRVLRKTCFVVNARSRQRRGRRLAILRFALQAGSQRHCLGRGADHTAQLLRSLRGGLHAGLQRGVETH